MEKRYQRIVGLVILIFAAGLIMGSVSAAGEKKDMKGWERDSPYNQKYDIKEYEKFRAWVVGFKEESPMKGMSEATIMIVKDGEDLIDNAAQQVKCRLNRFSTVNGSIPMQDFLKCFSVSD